MPRWGGCACRRRPARRCNISFLRRAWCELQAQHAAPTLTPALLAAPCPSWEGWPYLLATLVHTVEPLFAVTASRRLFACRRAGGEPRAAVARPAGAARCAWGSRPGAGSSRASGCRAGGSGASGHACRCAPAAVGQMGPEMGLRLRDGGAESRQMRGVRDRLSVQARSTSAASGSDCWCVCGGGCFSVTCSLNLSTWVAGMGGRQPCHNPRCIAAAGAWVGCLCQACLPTCAVPQVLFLAHSVFSAHG